MSLRIGINHSSINQLQCFHKQKGNTVKKAHNFSRSILRNANEFCKQLQSLVDKSTKCVIQWIAVDLTVTTGKALTHRTITIMENVRCAWCPKLLCPCKYVSTKYSAFQSKNVTEDWNRRRLKPKKFGRSLIFAT